MQDFHVFLCKLIKLLKVRVEKESWLEVTRLRKKEHKKLRNICVHYSLMYRPVFNNSDVLTNSKKDNLEVPDYLLSTRYHSQHTFHHLKILPCNEKKNPLAIVSWWINQILPPENIWEPVRNVIARNNLSTFLRVWKIKKKNVS